MAVVVVDNTEIATTLRKLADLVEVADYQSQLIIQHKPIRMPDDNGWEVWREGERIFTLTLPAKPE